MIPTSETARQDFFISALLQNEVPLLLIGPTGTGKTAQTMAFLGNLPQDKYIVNTINFSARTTADQAQDVIMSKVDR